VIDHSAVVRQKRESVDSMINGVGPEYHFGRRVVGYSRREECSAEWQKLMHTAAKSVHLKDVSQEGICHNENVVGRRQRSCQNNVSNKPLTK